MSTAGVVAARLVRGSPAQGGGGPTLLFADDFSHGNLSTFEYNGVPYFFGTAGTTNAAIVSAESAGLPGGGNVCRIDYSNAGVGSGAARQLAIGPFPSTTHLCVSFELWIPVGFGVLGEEDGTFYNMKLGRAWSNDYEGTEDILCGQDTWFVDSAHRIDPSARRWVPADAPNGYGANGPIPTRVAQPNPSLWTNAAYQGRFVPKGQEYIVASEANNDGIIRTYLDGTMVRDDNQCQMYNPFGNNFFNYLNILGASNNGHPENTFVYLRNVRVSSGGFA